MNFTTLMVIIYILSTIISIYSLRIINQDNIKTGDEYFENTSAFLVLILCFMPMFNSLLAIISFGVMLSTLEIKIKWINKLFGNNTKF